MCMGHNRTMIYLNENVNVACLRNMQNVIINVKLCIVSFMSLYINVSFYICILNKKESYHILDKNKLPDLT